MAKKIDLTGLEHFKEEENESIAYIESSSTASKAHKVGERFYFKGKLVICTADIASGGTITLNTNCKLDVLGDDVTAQSEQIDSTGIFEESEPFNWYKLADLNNTFGWSIGYYKSEDGTVVGSNERYLRTGIKKFVPDDTVSHFTITAPSGYAVAAFEYGSDGYIERHGDMNTSNVTATTSVTVQHTSGHYYAFCIGRFSGNNSSTFITEEFLSTIVLKYYAINTKIIPALVDNYKRKSHLNILIFGNSYSADSWAYVPFILKKYGITSNIYFYYRGSGSVDRLVAEWESTTATGTDAFGKSHVRRATTIDTRKQRQWQGQVQGYSAKMLLELANNNNLGINQWDLIVLNQGSRQQSFTVAPGNGDPRKGTEPYIRQVINLINASYTKPYTLAWFEGYTSFDGYDGNEQQGYPPITPESMDNRVGVLKATETIMMAEPFNMVIPAGTAVFNARTNASLASTDLSVTGNLWCSDKVHLQAGIPNYIANCAVVQSIFNKFFPEFSILGDDTRITDQLITDYACPFISGWCGSVLDSTELLYDLGQKAAVMACKYPYDITPIYLPTDTTDLALFDTHNDRYWADALITQPST